MGVNYIPIYVNECKVYVCNYVYIFNNNKRIIILCCKLLNKKYNMFCFDIMNINNFFSVKNRLNKTEKTVKQVDK